MGQCDRSILPSGVTPCALFRCYARDPNDPRSLGPALFTAVASTAPLIASPVGGAVFLFCGRPITNISRLIWLTFQIFR